jgi:hypothetical protein
MHLHGPVYGRLASRQTEHHTLWSSLMVAVEQIIDNAPWLMAVQLHGASTVA